MKVGDGEVGQLVNHKLMGRCMIIKSSAKGYSWEIRMPNGNILMVQPEELEALPQETKAEKLRRYAKATMSLAEAALKEAEALDGR